MNKKRDGIPVTQKIVRALEAEIESGVLAAGSRLPSVRELAEQYRISTAVCLSAYRALEKQGLVERRAGSGTYVRGQAAGENADPAFFNWYCIFPALPTEEAFRKIAPELPINNFPAFEYTYNRQYLEWLRGKERQAGLAALDEGQLPHLAHTGALLPLDELLEKSGLDRDGFPPELLRSMSWNGKLYALPVAWRPLVLLYNRRIFRELSLPEPTLRWQWKELLEYTKLLTGGEEGRIRRYGLAILFTMNSYVPFIRQAGGEFFDANGNCAIDSDAAFEGLNFFSELLRQPGACLHTGLGGSRSSLADLMSHDLAAMLLGDGIDYLLLEERMAAGDWGMIPPPGKCNHKGSLSVWGIGLTPGARPGERFRTLEQLFAPEVYREYCAGFHSQAAYAPKENGVPEALLKLLPDAVPSLQSTSAEAMIAISETIDPILRHKLQLTRELCRELQRKINIRL